VRIVVIAPHIEATDGRKPDSFSQLTNLDALPRPDKVLGQYDIDTSVLASSRPDRAELFRALDSCYEHDVTARIYAHHAGTALTTGSVRGNWWISI
jgi:hypothetical protein